MRKMRIKRHPKKVAVTSTSVLVSCFSCVAISSRIVVGLGVGLVVGFLVGLSVGIAVVGDREGDVVGEEVGEGVGVKRLSKLVKF